ncbi:hypothetical protein DSO57_1009938 [Entomophthora muscae]|uniref:Uncharacterized protein n=1 Tax=Entomophthora muscae TaxID=34485 RepID=A0ACC2THK1_9FUNG|nr:hypothetical protein DSO57_1009938 [Entomophthora muscae]
MFNLNNLLPGQMKPAASDPRKRFRISAFQVQALEDIFKNNPRPCKEIQEGVAQQLGLPYRTVTIWFQNRRAKAKTAGEPLAGHVFQWKPPVVSSQPTRPKEKAKEKPPPAPRPANLAWPDQPYLGQGEWPYLDSASFVSGDFPFPIDFVQPPLEPFPMFVNPSHSVASLSTQDSASFYNMNFYSQSLPHFQQSNSFEIHPAQSAPTLPTPTQRPAKPCQNDAMFFSMRS